MKILLHYKLDKTEGFLKEFKTLHQQYKNRDFQFTKNFNHLADTAIQFFEEINLQEMVSKIRILQTEYYTAMEGIHPLTLEKVQREKRTMQRSFAFKNLCAFEEIIQMFYEKLKENQSSAVELIQQIVLAAIQNHILDFELMCKREYNVEEIWKSIILHFEFDLMHKKLLMQLNSIDILILVEKVLDKILSVNIEHPVG